MQYTKQIQHNRDTHTDLWHKNGPYRWSQHARGPTKAITQSPVLGTAPTHDADSVENRMTANCSILTDLGAMPLFRRSLKSLLLRPRASLTLICASRAGISSGNSYLWQKSSIERFPRNPEMSRAGRRKPDLSYFESASWSSSSDIFGGSVMTWGIGVGRVGLVAGSHPEACLGTMRNKKKTTGVPGGVSGFVITGGGRDRCGLNNEKLDIGALVLERVIVVDRLIIVDRVLVMGKVLVVIRGEGVEGWELVTSGELVVGGEDPAGGG
ncbi:hypothetical protein BJY52DRAFT_1406939 [Lactarius psammicola]|nr:hypothetical protein BJY52DRAFT_1406939 [Lactarius psammicola]